MAYKKSLIRPFRMGKFYSYCILALMGIALTGCWEEIQYEPVEIAELAKNEPSSGKDSSPPDELRDTPEEELPSASPEQDSLLQNAEAGEPVGDRVPVEDVTPREDAAPVKEMESITEEADEEPISSSPVVDEKVEEEERVISTPLLEKNEASILDDILADDSFEATADSEEKKQTQLPESTVEEFRTPKTALATWRMASQWSYAAALYSKGVKEKRYGEFVEKARYAAQLLEVDLPEFSVDVSIEKREKAIRELLQKDATQEMANRLSRLYGRSYVALAELAVRSNLLLLSYSPGSSRVDELLLELRRAAQETDLSPKVYEDLISLLEKRADFQDVKAAVYRLHRDVPVELGKMSQ